MASSTISDIRVEEIPDYCKPSTHKVSVRVFKKETSVFALWKEDNATVLKQTALMDFSQWKCDRLIKDEADYADVMSIIQTNFVYLKDIYLDLQTNSTYPFI